MATEILPNNKASDGPDGDPTLTNLTTFESLLPCSRTPPFQLVNTNSPSISKSNDGLSPLSGADLSSFRGDAAFWGNRQGANHPGRFDTAGSYLRPLQTQSVPPAGYELPNCQSIPLEGSSRHTVVWNKPFPESSNAIAPDDRITEGNKEFKERLKQGNIGGGRSIGRKVRKGGKVGQGDHYIDVAEEAKRERFLDRNRVAATKCRQKKREWTKNLEERVRELTVQREMLTTYVSVLKNELFMLKSQCLEHSDCDCEHIREYLKNTLHTFRPPPAALYTMEADLS